MKRGIAKITVYVYGESDQDFFNEAKRYEKALLEIDDNRANVESLTTAPTGTIDPMDHCEIDISKMETKSISDHYDQSRLNYLKEINSGESHLEYYRDKHPENHRKLMENYDL